MKPEPLFRVLLNLTLTLLTSLPSMGQKYDFVNYTIENGLVQSQVNNIIQDQHGMLWISTLGGLSRFDGKEFTNYNFGKGLLHSLAEVVFVSNNNTIWIGSNDGIQTYDGIKFRSIEFAAEGQRKTVIDIIQAVDHTMYVLLNDHKIYMQKSVNSRFEKFADSLKNITAIYADSSMLYAAIYKKGIFRYNNGSWTPLVKWQHQDTMLNIRRFEKSRFKNGIWAVGTTKLLWIEGNDVVEYPINIKPLILSFEEISSEELFIGSLNGAYKYKPGQAPEYIGRKQGLSDNAINDIYTDKEGNIWFGTDGNGFYRYHDRSFTIYDQTTGLHGNVVMSLVKDTSQNIWAGTLEGGLNKIQKNGQITNVTVDPSISNGEKINCLNYSSDGTLWIGTINNGLWQFVHNKFIRLGKDIMQFPRSFTSLVESSDGSMWITSPKGVLRMKNNKPEFISSIKNSCYSSYEWNRDSVIIGTSTGLMLVRSDLSSKPFDIEGTKGFLIGSIKPWKDFIIFGTSENGLIFWNKKTNKSYTCNEASGLTSNMTFSILPEDEAIYTGTINGLNRIKVKQTGEEVTFQVTPISSSNQKLGPECNQNSILKDAKGCIWLGTTNGIYQYDPKKSLPLKAPEIYLKSIDIFSRPLDSTFMSDSTFALTRIPVSLQLKPTQNHLTFTVTGLLLSAPEKIKYQYYLVGADTIYTGASPTPTVIYPNLIPGQYTFKAKALIEAYPTLYSDELSYSFVINPPFYQKTWFRLSFIAALILMGALIQKYRMALKNKQLRLVEEVRKQEQLKIQQRTSEDLHDDLGNKITRLSLLTEILQTKISGDDDQNKLLSQIRENIQGLYMGTKDIIWALAPNHNSLSDAVQRIVNFGMEMFQDSTIQFKTGDIDPSFKALKPPFEFSRNVIMISKEALHNILKHSNAEHASIEFSYPINTYDDPGMLKIEIKDDGLGLNGNLLNLKGNGLDNMKKRIERIGGTIRFLPNLPSGTRILIEVKIPQSVG
jgi:ligand-binding sensor domain-containing protein/signal transduction histidine kinase